MQTPIRFMERLNWTITTNKGHIEFEMPKALEGYNFYVISDETGTFEEGDYDVISRDEIEEAFGFR